MRPPPTRIGNGGRYFRTNASIGPESTSSDTPAISKSLRSKLAVQLGHVWELLTAGIAPRRQKFTSVTLPRNAASLTCRPRGRAARARDKRLARTGCSPVGACDQRVRVEHCETPLASTATAVSRAPRCRVARIAPVAGRARPLAGVSRPNRRSRARTAAPPAGAGGRARARRSPALSLSRRSAPLAGRNSGSGSLPAGNSPRFAVQLSWPAGVYLRISSRTAARSKLLHPAHRHRPRVHHVVEQRRRRPPESGESPDGAPQGIEHPDQGAESGSGVLSWGNVVRRPGGGHPARTRAYSDATSGLSIRAPRGRLPMVSTTTPRRCAR